MCGVPSPAPLTLTSFRVSKLGELYNADGREEKRKLEMDVFQ
jgi:hypothetical protein